MKVKSYSKAQSGFTLIELVVVIVILGILAAVAIPRFADMSAAAKTAAVDGMRGAVQSASAIAHAQALVNSATSGVDTVQLEGNTVHLNGGYPTVAGIQEALAAHDGFTYATSGAGTAIFGLDKATASATCAVTYTPNASGTAAPVIGAVYGGC